MIIMIMMVVVEIVDMTDKQELQIFCVIVLFKSIPTNVKTYNCKTQVTLNNMRLKKGYFNSVFLARPLLLRLPAFSSLDTTELFKLLIVVL
jgi:hypothetical protein